MLNRKGSLLPRGSRRGRRRGAISRRGGRGRGRRRECRYPRPFCRRGWLWRRRCRCGKAAKSATSEASRKGVAKESQRRRKGGAKERGVRDVRDIVRVGSTCTFLTFREGAWDFGPLTFLGPRGWGVAGRSSRPRETAADTIDSSEEGGEEEEWD